MGDLDEKQKNKKCLFKHHWGGWHEGPCKLDGSKRKNEPLLILPKWRKCRKCGKIQNGGKSDEA